MISEMKEHAKLYCSSTTVHGLKYIGVEKPLVIKAFWVAVAIAGFTAASLLFKELQTDWEETPMIITIDSLDMPVETIPFPTVTVCFSNKYPEFDGLTKHIMSGLKFECSTDDIDCDTGPSSLRQYFANDFGNTTRSLFKSLKVNGKATFSDQDASWLCRPSLNLTTPESWLKLLSQSYSKTNWLPYSSNMDQGNYSLCNFSQSERQAIFALTELVQASEKIDFGQMFSFLNPLGSIMTNDQERFWLNVVQPFQPFLYTMTNGSRSLSNLPYKLEVISDKRDKDKCFQQWSLFLRNLTSSNYPCGLKSDAARCCSNYSLTSGQDLKQVFTMMKQFTIGRSFRASPLDLLKMLKVTKNLAGFPLKESYTSVESIDAIPFCFFGYLGVKKHPKQTCKRFQPVATSKGVCLAFNARPIQETLGQSSTAFVEAFDAAFPSQKSHPIHYGDSVRMLRFLLDLSQLDDSAREDHFLISITDLLNSFDATHPILVQVGHINKIYVQPVVKISKRLHDMPLEQRKCRFSNEVINDTMTIFKTYTRQSCLMECRMAIAMEMCRCRPWDQPFNEFHISLPFCDSFHYSCFNVISNNATLNEMPPCDTRCPSDCELTIFEVVRTEVVPIPKYAGCTGQSDDIVWAFNQHLVPPKKTIFQQVINTMSPNHPSEKVKTPYDIINELEINAYLTEHCPTFSSKKIAIVSVYYASPTFIQYTQMKKIEDGDKISQLGGILGLITGMSFISIVEFLYWAVQFVVKRLQRSDLIAKADSGDQIQMQ